MYKKHRHYIDEHGNSLTEKDAKLRRLSYAYSHQYCESCGCHSFLAVHHHIKQQFTYHGETYCLEMPINYSVLCNECHQQVHASSNQYERNNHRLPKEYWLTLKRWKRARVLHKRVFKKVWCRKWNRIVLHMIDILILILLMKEN